MMRRKICLWLMIFGFLGFLGGLHQVQAGEVDALHLINLLKQKGILTQEEADGLMKEARKQAMTEKAELKEEIKKEGEKGAYLPKALKDFGFSTTIFAEFNAKDTENGGKTTNQFLLNRAYLTLKKKLTPWLGMNLTTDIFTSKDANDVGQGLEVRQKYAMLELYLGGTTTELGLTHTPSDQYDSDIWPYRVQDKHYLDKYGIQASADFGLNIRGPFGPTVDTAHYYGSSTYNGKWGGYQIGVYNGPGYNNTENNTNKAVSGLVYLRPLPNIDMLKGLQLAYVGTYGQSNANFTAKGKTNDYPDWQVNIAQLSYQHKWFTLMGQYYWGKGTATSTEDNSRSGWVAAGFVRIPGVEKMRVFGKMDNYDPNTDASNNATTTYTAGISYDLTKEFMPYLAWERTDYENPKTADTNMYQVGFQLKF
jgi:hypothetical protein